MHKLWAGSLLCAVFNLASCAAPGPDSSQLDFKTIYAQKPAEAAVVMVTVVASRRPDNGVPLQLGPILFVEPGESETGGHRYIELKQAAMDPVDNAAVYSGIVTLRPGRYILTRIGFTVEAALGPVDGEIPIQAEFDVPRTGAVYVGRINAVMRPRTGDEFRAGIFSLEHMTSGVFGSTFDVSFTDNSAEDIPYFINNYHYLSRPAIVTSILPPFDRAKAQWLWENNRLFIAGPLPGGKAP